ncbi:MAG: NUDIX domain-containing protein [Bacteroidota bacterium]
MNLFINDTPFFLLRSTEEAQPLENKTILSAIEVSSLKDLSGAVIITDVKTKRVIELLHELMNNQFEDVSFRILPKNYNKAKAMIKQHFKIIDAAGGVVKDHNGDVLLIYRLKKWDIPKGKLDKGETFRMTAKREVEEETGVKIKLKNRITTTWHTYTIKDKPILKRNQWYEMQCLDSSELRPQKKEGIDKAAFMNKEESEIVLRKSYRSIRYVMRCYWDGCDEF